MSAQNFISPKSSILSYNDLSPRIEDDLFLACGGRIIGDVRISKGVSIWFNAVVRGE
jgi:carbonic anhydrase/acetyltransferase-like protein (isoleucine patch superfamily)